MRGGYFAQHSVSCVSRTRPCLPSRLEPDLRGMSSDFLVGFDFRATAIPPWQFSGGEKAHHVGSSSPEAQPLLLDEPTNHLASLCARR